MPKTVALSQKLKETKKLTNKIVKDNRHLSGLRKGWCNFKKKIVKMAPLPVTPSTTGDSNKKDIEDVAAEAKNAIERFLGDISKTSATQQLIIGSASGWITGMVAAKVGKMAGVALGGGIIALQIANHQGYVTVNWDKVMRRVDKVADKVEESVTNEAPKWMDKVGSFARRNTCLAAGFAGGFFIGLSYA